MCLLLMHSSAYTLAAITEDIHSTRASTALKISKKMQFLLKCALKNLKKKSI